MQRPFHPSPKPRVRTALLAAIGGLVLFGAFAAAGSAEAACRCQCLNGKSIPVCSSGTDIPPICNSTACPLSPPPRLPADANRPVPKVIPGCTLKEVYDPKTKRYSWQNLCR